MARLPSFTPPFLRVDRLLVGESRPTRPIATCSIERKLLNGRSCIVWAVPDWKGDSKSDLLALDVMFRKPELEAEDIAAARPLLRDLIGPITAVPTESDGERYLTAHFPAFSVEGRLVAGACFALSRPSRSECV